MFVALCVFAPLLYRAGFTGVHDEGDEIVHMVLVNQLAQGHYTLQHTIVAQLPQLFSPFLYDRPLHYHPPLYNLLLLGLRRSLGDYPYVAVSVLATVISAAMVFRITRRRTSLLSALFATALFSLCPIVYLVTIKIWAEATLACFLCLLFDFYDRRCIAVQRDGEPPPLSVLPVVLLLAAAVLTKFTALFVLPALLWAAVISRSAPFGRRWIVAILLVPCVTAGLWSGAVWYANHGWVPRNTDPTSRMANVFVAAMQNKHPLTFFYTPVLLNPGYAFAAGALRRSQLRSTGHLALAAACILFTFSTLGWLGVTTYHNKYIGVAMPFLAILAGIGFDAARRSMPHPLWRYLPALLGFACVAFLLYEHGVHSRLARLSEVSPDLYGSSAQGEAKAAAAYSSSQGNIGK
jgi:4-amino-4-deoxy-L-arabinose transferase-like glycosyltransferase